MFVLTEKKDDESATQMLRQQHKSADEQFDAQKKLQMEKWRIEVSVLTLMLVFQSDIYLLRCFVFV
jgi:hypothetical protein